jgi:hypothetical protein
MIIGLTGKKGSGKSTVASLLNKGYGYTVMGFGDPIKKMLSSMGVPTEYLFDPGKKEEVIPDFGKSARFMMQTLGSAWARDILGADVWVKSMDRRLGALQIEQKIDEPDCVIDDVRFQNEADYIHGVGGKIILVTRAFESPADVHESERGLDPREIDATINNISCYTTDLAASLNQYMEASDNGLIHLTQP